MLPNVEDRQTEFPSGEMAMRQNWPPASVEPQFSEHVLICSDDRRYRDSMHIFPQSLGIHLSQPAAAIIILGSNWKGIPGFVSKSISPRSESLRTSSVRLGVPNVNRFSHMLASRNRTRRTVLSDSEP